MNKSASNITNTSLTEDFKIFEENLFQKIRVLNETIWENKVDRNRINKWLNNFTDSKEKIHALYLLSQFMYFGSLQMRELLKVLFRDLYKYRVIEKIRMNNANTTDMHFIQSEFEKVLYNTKFLGVGNPSESGTHLLYFFRQENKLPKSLFIESSKIFSRKPGLPISLSHNNAKEFVFLDDLCGSGTQAKEYSDEIVEEIKYIDPTVEVSYLMLFSTKDGIDFIRKSTKFDHVEAIFELDNSFKCFNMPSRYFNAQASKYIDQKFAENFCSNYGSTLMEAICVKEKVPLTHIKDCGETHSLGYKGSQLLLGFHHNTPDNSLPIFWYDEEEVNWYPIFRRYNKIYG